MEHGRVDAARDHGHTRAVRPVEAAQLAELDLARRDDGRGSPDRIALDLDTHVALTIDVLVQHFTLDQAERMEHLDDGDVPALLERPRHLRRKPVVRVHDVVAPALAFDMLEELRGELVEMLIHGHLRPVADRTRWNVNDACVGPDLLDARVVLLPPAREHVDLDAALAEVARELAHVDIHTARIAAAELRQRARVHRDHRDARRLHRRVASIRTSQRSVAPRSYL